MSNQIRVPRLEMTLSDRLEQDSGWIYLTGMQALVRLPIQQAKRDKAAGLNTGGYISGYRGSPVGRYDMDLLQVEKKLKEHNIVFQPGLNEDMAATAVWGSQMVGLFPGARVDGVFSIWYGKAPGLDRSMDPVRHANLAGTNAKGGSLLLVGDDHGAKSSTVAGYSDLNFVSTGIPLLAPANAQEVLEFGLHGIAMSRYTGTLVGMKLVTDVIEGGGSVQVGPDSPKIVLPLEDDVDVSIRPFRPILDQEKLLWDKKIKRALDYSRINVLNRVNGSPDARVGVISSGKAWQDLSQALASMGYKEGVIGAVPLRTLQVGMVWPLDSDIVRDFCKGLDAIIVVEEKRGLLEDQIRATLYGSDLSPKIVGKSFYEANGETAFPNYGEIEPGLVADVVARVLKSTDSNYHLPMLNRLQSIPSLSVGTNREPTFCAGCPHGRSTQVIKGSRALAGIGCHTMAAFRDPTTTNSISHMGGEGGLWLGQFHFTDEPHVFANMGDGTYSHSGLMAIRAAVAANAPMTYKLLHNGFVSMTGGQQIEGGITPRKMVGQLLAEGVKRIALVSDEPGKFRDLSNSNSVTVHSRHEMEIVQEELRKIPEVTVLIYDQPCATERRRLRKRGKLIDPDKRIFINSAICEGCGDCSTVSQCMAVEPMETHFGRKRKINQSSCNKDFSCVEGFCPSFVTVSGVKLRQTRNAGVIFDTSHLPYPKIAQIQGSWSILVSGIGGAGVVTAGQMLAIAAHADGYFSSNLDITGLAQKYGAVHSHIKIASRPNDMRATRIASNEADALIGCDLVVAAGDETLAKLKADSAIGITDTTIVPTGEFSRNPDWTLDKAEQLDRLTHILGNRIHSMDAQGLAEQIMGDRLFANMLLVGAAWQQGGLPLSHAALMRAIELNGVAIDKNKQAFELGRLVLADAPAAKRLLEKPDSYQSDNLYSPTLSEIIKLRKDELTAYQNAALGKRYVDRIEKLRDAGLPEDALKAVARGYYKLLAVKDEWEVARLYSQPEFCRQLEETFEGKPQLTFHVGAWPFGKRDKSTGKIRKGEVGGWLLNVFRVMCKLRGIRGSILDPFRGNAEAKLARKVLKQYEDDLDFAEKNSCAAVEIYVTELLNQPEFIRGYGHVRERHLVQVDQRRAEIHRQIEETLCCLA